MTIPIPEKRGWGGVPPEKPGSGLFQQKQLQNSPVSIIIYVKNRHLNGVITTKNTNNTIKQILFSYTKLLFYPIKHI